MSDFLAKCNPFYKLVLVLAFSIFLTFTRAVWMHVWVFGLCMLLLVLGARPKQWLRALWLLLPVSVLAFSIFMTGWHFGTEEAGPWVGFHLATRFYAFAGLGIIFALTTQPYELIKSLQKDAKLPRKFAYGMLCAINLFPYIKNEYNNARLAFQVRGTRLTLFSLKPIFSMLVNSIRWSEVLSMAMYSKGFYEDND